MQRITLERLAPLRPSIKGSRILKSTSIRLLYTRVKISSQQEPSKGKVNPVAPTRCTLQSVFKHNPRRIIHIESFTAILWPPAVFFGLVLTLWVYKCVMMILFQNKIIYMPSVPPFSRREVISDYASTCLPIVWSEEKISSLDGTSITLCIGSNISQSPPPALSAAHVVVLYFQGNASSIPPRLPMLSSILKGTDVPCTIIALSYRGFWKSSGSASQKGIELDALAALEWAQNYRAKLPQQSKLILYGQSIGAGVATTTVARKPRGIDGLILETPFISIREMLVSLYPQRWLPYRYLWPFLWNWWDSKGALTKLRGQAQFPILLLTAGRDEVVPSSHGPELVRICRENNLAVESHDVRGALHHEALTRQEARVILARFLRRAYNAHSTQLPPPSTTK